MKERSTLLLSLALLGGLAAGSYWLAEQARLGDQGVRPKRHEPDYFVDQFSLTRMDPTGKGRYTVRASRVVHYPDDDSTEMVAPRLVSLAPDRPQVNMRADTGRISSDGVEVHLIGDVQVHRAADGQSAATVLRSPYLLVLPEQDIARTDREVDMVQGASRLTGRGLEFDNTQRLVRLNPNNQAGVRVHTTIAPKNKAAPAAPPSR